MIVQDHPNDTVLRVVIIQLLEQQDVFPTAVPGVDLCEDFAAMALAKRP